MLPKQHIQSLFAMRIQWFLIAFVFLSHFLNCAGSRAATPFVTDNTTYVISSRIDLQGGTIAIPSKCTLDFRGGSFVNGRLICNETTLKGKPRVEDISGTVTNDVFYSSWVTSRDKLSILCAVKADKIVLDEDLTLRTHSANDFKSSVLDGDGHVIKIDYDLFELKALIRCFDNVRSIKNLHFDFGNHQFHSIALWFPHRTESLDISNVSFSNLNNDTVGKYGFQGIGISAKEVQGYSFNDDITIVVSQINAYNMKALTDNSGEDGESTMTIVYLNCDVPSKVKKKLSVKVDDCDFKEIVVHNKNGEVVANDSACIYVHQDVTSTNSNVHISNISGYNFGRRLVKTDGGNIFIENIKGESYNGGSLCMVGCNNGDVPHSANKASINSLTFKGRISYVVACMVDNSIIRGIDAEFNDYIKPRVLSGVVFVGDDATCQIEGVKVKGKSFLFCSTSQTRVVIHDVKLSTDDHIAGIHYLFNTKDINSLELSDFVFDIVGTPPLLTTYQNANPSISSVNSRIIIRDGTINHMGEAGGAIIKDYSTRHPYSLSVENVSINVRYGTAPVISISSPTLRSVVMNNVEVAFAKANNSAKVMSLECNNTANYSLSKIICGEKLSSSPISISGPSESRVTMRNISVNGRVSVNGKVRVINK